MLSTYMLFSQFCLPKKTNDLDRVNLIMCYNIKTRDEIKTLYRTLKALKASLF